jgi:hypothetical protein
MHSTVGSPGLASAMRPATAHRVVRNQNPREAVTHRGHGGVDPDGGSCDRGNTWNEVHREQRDAHSLTPPAKQWGRRQKRVGIKTHRIQSDTVDTDTNSSSFSD